MASPLIVIISMIVSLIVAISIGAGLYFVLSKQPQNSSQAPEQSPEPAPVDIQSPSLGPSDQSPEPVASSSSPMAPSPQENDISQQYIGKFYRIQFPGNVCVYPNSIWGCWDDPNMVFKIDDATNGKVRLHHVLSNKCMYVDKDTLSLASFGCWGDPNMEFKIIKASDGKLKLQHQNSQTCLKVDSQENGSPVSGGDCNNSNVLLDLVEVSSPPEWVSQSLPGSENVSSNGIYACKGALPNAVAVATGVQSDAGMVQPGSFINNECKIGFGGKVYTGDNPEFLKGNTVWSSTKPANQVLGGVDRDALPLYVCRAEKDGVKYIGKKQEKWDFCDIAVGGEELAQKSFEYLGY